MDNASALTTKLKKRRIAILMVPDMPAKTGAISTKMLKFEMVTVLKNGSLSFVMMYLVLQINVAISF